MEVKYGKRFMFGWILSSLAMFGLSYVWHGVVLNDYAILTYPFQIYLISAAVVYLVSGFLLTRIFIAEFLDRISFFTSVFESLQSLSDEVVSDSKLFEGD